MDWIAEHWLETLSLVLIAVGVWWMMPTISPRPKTVGIVISLAGILLLVTRLDASQNFGHTVLFSTFAISAILSAVLMITNRKPVYSALWFALATFSTCGLFLLQYAPFLAAATVIIYAGAIVVTFVFVIMLAQQAGATIYDQRSRQPLLATVTAIVLLGAMLGTLRQAIDQSSDAPTVTSAEPVRLSTPAAGESLASLQNLGRSLFGDYLFAVELAGTLLLIALIGAIAIAPRRRRGTL